MTLRILIIFFVIIWISACNKPDPEPEKKDPIYADLQAELGISQREIAEVEKQLSDYRSDLERVKPQTGKIKYAQKRYFETEKALDMLKQREKYWKIRIEERARFVRQKSMEAYQQGRKWESGNEYEEYLAEKRLRRAKLVWDARQRREDALKEIKAESGPDSSSSKEH